MEAGLVALGDRESHRTVMSELELIKHLPDGAAAVLAAMALFRIGKLEARVDDIIQHLGVTPKKKPSRVVRTLPFAVVAIAFSLLVMGCANVSQTVREETTGTNGVVIIRETTARAAVIGDAKNTVDRLKVTNGKTQAIGYSAEQSSSSSNLVELLYFLLQAARK